VPWVQLVAMFVGEASKPLNVGSADASQYQLRSSPAPAIFGAILGTAVIGGLLYVVLKR
jgi:hypothetical protein